MLYKRGEREREKERDRERDGERELERERERELERERQRERERLFSSSLSDGNSLWSFSGMLICLILYCSTEAQLCHTVGGNFAQLCTLRVGRNSAIQRKALPYGVSIALYKSICLIIVTIP